MPSFVILRNLCKKYVLLSLNLFCIEDMCTKSFYFFVQQNIQKHLKSILISSIRTLPFIFEQQKKKKKDSLSFLDIEISRENNENVTSVYQKPTFSGVLFPNLINRVYLILYYIADLVYAPIRKSFFRVVKISSHSSKVTLTLRNSLTNV